MEPGKHICAAVVLLGYLISIISTSASPIYHVSYQRLADATQVPPTSQQEHTISTDKEAPTDNVQTTVEQDTATSSGGNGVTALGTAISTITSTHADITTDVITTTDDVLIGVTSHKPPASASTLAIISTSTPGMSNAPPITPEDGVTIPTELQPTGPVPSSTPGAIPPTTLQNAPDRTQLVNIVGLVIGATLGALVIVLGSVSIVYQRQRKKHSAQITSTLELKDHLYNGTPDCTITVVEMKPLSLAKFTRIPPDLPI